MNETTNTEEMINMNNTYTTETIKVVDIRGNEATVKVIITWQQKSSVTIPIGIEVLSLDGKPINVKVMQSLNLGAIMKDARRRNFNKPRVSSEEIQKHVTSSRGVLTEIEQLEIIASLYVEAHELGEPVQQYVADRIGKSKATTVKMIMKARQEGLIPLEASRRRKPRVMPRVSQQH